MSRTAAPTRAARRARATTAPIGSDDLAALDAWADAFHGAQFDETLHRAVARFIASAVERHSLLDPFTVPLV